MGNDTSLCLQPFAVPLPIANTTTCPPGYFCPNSTASNPLSVPQICPPTIECQVARLAGNYCEPQGVYEPQLCVAGFYCPNQYHMNECPEHYFCPVGAVSPSPCAPFSHCPAGSGVQTYWGGLLIALSADLLLVVLLLFHRLWYAPRKVAAAKARLALRRAEGEVPQHVVAAFLVREERKAAAYACTAMGARFKSLWTSLLTLLGLDRGGGAAGGGGGGGGSGGGEGGLIHVRSLGSLRAEDGGMGGGNEGGGNAMSARLVKEEEDEEDEVEAFAMLARPGAAPATEQEFARRVLLGGFEKANGGLRLAFEFEHVRWELPPPLSTVILEDVTGAIRPGRVTAIMGPSGAGKTSFLSVLMGKVPRTGGVLRINGVEDEISRFKRVLGFVPQEDVMMTDLTVRENVRFAARMRLPRSWPDARVDEHVEAVITVLGLAEVADQPIGDVTDRGISGGQRKRVNIGMELSVAPAVLFLDEPTSGLDAAAALEVCHTLRRVADLGVTVVAVIHQPRIEIFDAMDDLLLLEPGGRVAFMGPQAGVVPWFQSLGFHFPPTHNPADEILDAVAGKKGPIQLPSTTTTTHLPPTASAVAAAAVTVNASVDEDDLAASDRNSDRHSEGNSVRSRTRSPSKSMSMRAQLRPSRVWARRGREWLRQLMPILDRRKADADEEGEEGGGGAGGGGLVRGLNVEDLDTGSVVSTGSTPSFWNPYSSSTTAQAPSATTSLNASSSSSSSPPASSAGQQAVDADAMMQARGASFVLQVWLCLWRSLVQQSRAVEAVVLEVGVGLLAGLFMGVSFGQLHGLFRGVLQPPFILLSPAPWVTILPECGMYTALSVGVAGSPAGVKTFGEEKQVYFREASSGHSPLAYYLAKTVGAIPRFTLAALHFTAIFYFFANPMTSFDRFFSIVWLLFFCVYGLAALTSMVVRRENAALLAVIVALIAGALCGFGPSIKQGREWGIYWAQATSYARWSNEAFFHYESFIFRDHFLVLGPNGLSTFWGYTLDRPIQDLLTMLAIGLLYRIFAYLLLISLHRDKQK